MFYKILILLCLATIAVKGQNSDGISIRENYTKLDTMIAMRDGIKLYTVIYIPKDAGQKFPILMERTPYSSAPYGKDNYSRRIGPNMQLAKEKYIFVYQDVRGRYMSEGEFEDVRPFNKNKTGKQYD